jgi:DNA-binding transcriptional LysR family regulator
MLALAVAGAGMACLARPVGDRVPELQRIAMSPAPPTPTLWLGVHRDARATPRVRAVASHLSERLRAQQRQLCPPE